MGHNDATREEERRRAEHEEGGPWKIPDLAIEAWRREQAERAADDVTPAVTAIWDRYEQDVTWAARCRARGDTYRAELAQREGWARAERSFALLGEPPANTNRGRPDLRLVAAEHPAHGNPDPCLTCDSTGRLEDGRRCQLCAGRGNISAGDYTPASERPLLVDSSEEPTCIELPVLHGGQEVA